MHNLGDITPNYMLPNLKPKKSLGQNFLINVGILEKIAGAAELNKDDIVLEIGPGTGNLTRLLSEKAGQIIAIEKDHRLIDDLREKFKNTNVEIVEGDILNLDIDELFRNLKLETTARSRAVAFMAIENSNYKVVGNIPYYITSHLLKTIFEEWPKPKLIVLTVQKEVARRIVVRPPYMNLLALSVQLYSEPKIISYISKGSFRPIPKVDSAIIRLNPKSEARNPKQKEKIEKILKLAKKAFAGKRKQLQNTLPDIDLESLGINPKSRPEELSISDWLKM